MKVYRLGDKLLRQCMVSPCTTLIPLERSLCYFHRRGSTCILSIGHDGPCRATWGRRPICGARMARGDTCFRTPGHAYEHRSEYALANDRRQIERCELPVMVA